MLEPDEKQDDHCTRVGAERLARQIDRYWRGKGFPAIRVWLEHVKEGVWGVRSNMVGGIPPRT